MVPPIVFEAALSIDKRSFNRHVVPIIIYAVAGTLIATCLTAVVVHKGSEYFLCETIPFIEALLFGALISSIDPIAVLSVLSNMGMTDTDTIYVVIFGESLLNDGVAIVLFQTLVHFLDENMTVDSQALVAAAIHFLVVALGSVLVGVGSGMLCTVYYWMMHGCQTALVEVLIFFCWALLPYYVCDGVEWSGVVAVVTTGFVMDLTVVGQQRYDDPQEASERQQSPASPRERRRRKVFSREGHLSVEAKTHVGFVAEVVATMMETAIFAYLGLFLINSRYHWSIFHTFIAIGGCCLSRAIMIPTLSFFANWITRIQQFEARWRYNKLPQHSQEERTALHGPNIPAGVIIDKNMQLVLWFAGLRGAMSFALVENIPLYDATTGEGTRVKSELKAMTSACIIFTVFFLGGSTYYMMDLLGLAPTNPNDHPNVTAVEKETEMIGLLSKHSRDEDDEITHDDNGTTEKFHLDAKNRTTFRHRINADKESTD
jgi:NhaP-type Na+/H+ or K+/H+ antiporter